jgi:hypothetical protein
MSHAQTFVTVCSVFWPDFEKQTESRANETLLMHETLVSSHNVNINSTVFSDYAHKASLFMYIYNVGLKNL